MANHLLNEKSPYLLQHANNPVDWYPWGEEAFQKAKTADKPIFLSIGYATCHWCHVMAHESFEDETVARLLNEHYIAVKVDREERPDVDQVYMSVCQTLTGRGGWPLSIFMTPEGRPFFAGTYFPRTARMGMSGFTELLQQIMALWQKDRGKVLQAGDEITRSIQSRRGRGLEVILALGTLETGYEQLLKSFDVRWGGVGQAPKFPTPHHLTFLIRWDRRRPGSRAREMVIRTLEAMRSGGIFDHIGLGFHRYSVDARWLVPHFEKMLYDQALQVMAYTEAYQAWQDPLHSRVTRETLTYVLRDMTSPEGGFYSAEDADSEGREGVYYVWTPGEVKKHLGAELGDLFCRCYDIRARGNFEEGKSIPNWPVPLANAANREGQTLDDLEKSLTRAREILFEVRKRRIPPLKDDKIITAWNGLMIAALAKAAQALDEPEYARAAAKAADFVLEKMQDPSGRLYRRYREGELANPGYLEDYAFLVWGLIELYEATFKLRFLEEALRLNRLMIDLFWDEKGGGFYFTPRDGEALITREKEIYDGAVPSGNSVALLNLLRLSKVSGATDLEEKADRLLRAFSVSVAATPMAYTQFLNALDWITGPSQEIVIAGDPKEPATEQMVRTLQQPFLPNKILLFKSTGPEGNELSRLAPFAGSWEAVGGRPTAYLCQGYTCQRPLTDLDELRSRLQLISDIQG